jgi:uncharacterized damage-inducible protein DinB
VQNANILTWIVNQYEQTLPTFEELPPMMTWARRFHDAAAEYVAAQTPGSLAEPLPVAWASMVEQAIGRPPGITSRGDTVLQAAMHTHYHRGQVNMRLRELGETPPLVDYIAWVWYGRPVATWPAPAGD